MRRHTPDLEEVHRLGSVLVLAMANTRAGRSHLDVAALEDLHVSRGVVAERQVSTPLWLVIRKEYVLSQLALDNVREDLELAMPVRAEASARRDAILVDNSQGAKLHVVPVLVAEDIVSTVNMQS